MSSRNHLLDISWLVPGVFKGSGGHANIFRHVAYLSEFGHRNAIYCDDREDKFGSDDELREFICENFVDTKARIFRNWNLQTCDVAIATHWSTAYAVREFRNCSKKFYFVQDYEPYFHAAGSDYIYIENTYRFGFSCITLGRWLTHLLTERYNADADYFDFAFDDTVYRMLPGVKRKRRIAFYAQPNKPRRCFELGVRALKIVNRMLPEVEIVLFGSSAEPTEPLTFPHTSLGVVSPRQCAELYRSSQVGLILSATNPSLIPVEMMACGCPVVDLDRENNRFDYETGTISLADSTPEALAEAMIRLLEEKDVRQAQIDRALEMASRRIVERSTHKIETLLLNGWITGRLNQGENLQLDEFQPFANEEAALDSKCVQTFSPTQSNLCEIDICFANRQRIETNGTITCEVWDDEQDDAILCTEMPYRGVRDGLWHPLRVPVQPLSKDREYRLVIRSNGVNGSSPAVLYTTKDAYGRGRLVLGGKRVRGSLKFRTYCAETAAPRGVNHASIESAAPVSRNPTGLNEYHTPAGSVPSLSRPILFPLSSQELRQAITALNYPKAGILVRSARLLILIKHYSVWAWLHFRSSGSRAVRERAFRRLRLIFRCGGSEKTSSSA